MTPERRDRGDRAPTGDQGPAGLAALVAELVERLGVAAPETAAVGDDAAAGLRQSIVRLGREAVRLREAGKAGEAGRPAGDDEEGRG